MIKTQLTNFAVKLNPFALKYGTGKSQILEIIYYYFFYLYTVNMGVDVEVSRKSSYFFLHDADG
jgi:hypothetical protein